MYDVRSGWEEKVSEGKLALFKIRLNALNNIEEFFVASGGKDFIHLSPKEFISLYNPLVSDDIKDDLKKESHPNIIPSKSNNINDIIEKSIINISKILRFYDPLSISKYEIIMKMPKVYIPT